MTTAIRIQLEHDDPANDNGVWQWGEHLIAHAYTDDPEDFAAAMDTRFNRDTDDDDETSWYIAGSADEPAYDLILNTLGDQYANLMPTCPDGWDGADMTISILW